MRTLLGRFVPSKAKVGSGVGAIGLGVAWLTLNERRDVAARKLRLKAELAAMSLAQTDVENVDESLRDRLIHYQGTLRSDEPPADHDFGVTNKSLIAIKRRVEMYQWRESKQETKNKDGSVSTTYSYSLVWSPRHEDVTNNPDKRNPNFPSDLPPGEHVFLPQTSIYIGLLDRLILNDGLVAQLTDFKPVSLSSDYVKEDGEPFAHGLALNRMRTALTSGKGWKDAVGDLRVSYQGLFSGHYTAMAKLAFDQEQKKHLVPWSATLKQSLASQGEIRLPDDLNKILGIELDSFIIPEPIIAWAESVLLSYAPLHINYIAPGHKSLKACIQGIELKDYNTLMANKAIGGGVVFVGCLSLLPKALLQTPAGIMGAVGAAAMISYKAIQEAKPKSVIPASTKPDVEL